MTRRVAVTVASILLVGCSDRVAGPITPTGCATARSLTRGQVQTVTGAAALACIVVAGTTEASDYLVVTANATGVQDDLQSYRVTGEAGAGLSAERAPDAPPASWDAPADVATRMESRLRAASRQSMAPLSAGSREATAPRTPAVVAAAVVGDTLTYRVGDALASNMCLSFTTVRAVVRAIGTRALVVQDVTAPSNGFTATDFTAIAREFDSVVYPTDVQWFGDPSDINGDGRVTLLFTPAINRLTPAGSLGFVGGYFWSNDLIARSVPSQAYNCPSSNEQEIMYLLTPDPDGVVNGNRFTVPTVLKAMRGTIAHELQHLINQSVRQARSAPAEADWMNEGLSHLAEELVGRAVRGYSASRALTYADLLVDLDDFDAFFRQNLIRYRAWLSRPDLASPISRKAVSELAPRGASWALLRYAIDQYGGTTPATFTRALVSGPQVDVANLEARAKVSFGEVLPGFLLASAADTVALGARYRFASWNMRDAMAGINAGQYPLRQTALPTDATTQSLSGSGNFFVWTRAAGAGPFTVRMRGVSGDPIGFDGARAYVVRLR